MNTFLIILFIIILTLILLSIIYFYLYNKINETIIRVDEAENRIDNNLRDKYDLINRTVILIKNKIELDKDAFKDIIKLRSRKISNFELDRTLVASYNEFLALYENNKELKESDEIYKANKQLELIDEELITLRTYYNANITSYNKLIKKFPTNIIAKIKKYLKEHPEVKKYVILDDEIFGDYNELMDHLVKTNFFNNGLESYHVNQIVNLLGKKEDDPK